MANPRLHACRECFDDVALTGRFECADLLDAVEKTGFSARTLYRYCEQGAALAKRVGNGRGPWVVLLGDFGGRTLPVDPPRRCPHGHQQHAAAAAAG